MPKQSSSESAISLRPRISVCIATYNGERFVAAQLLSILRQLSAGDEVVISDDSSTDRTLAIVEELQDARIRIFSGQRFRSATYNFEHALKQARGQAIFLSDQDDEWVEGWVEAALAELRDVSLVVCGAHMIDAEGALRNPSEASIYRGSRGPGVLRNIYRNGYIGCCCAFRREVLDAALPFPKNLPWHDWWIGLVADAFYSTRFIPARMIRYRRHGANASPTGERSTNTAAAKLAMRWRIGFSLLRRALARP